MESYPIVPDTSQDVVRAYHARTKHRFDAYAEGPGQLDWDAQPAAFRHYPGAPILALPLAAERYERCYGQLPKPPENSVTPDLSSLGALLELAFGLSAWKSWGPNRWALRCNPSSGNLHPVEAYVLAGNFPGLVDGLHHYDPENHALEGRAFATSRGEAPWLAIGLSSIMWREAWKYGERAFRYCQLDVGHAVACLTYAAALLGWEVVPLTIDGKQLAHCLGLDRADDFPPVRDNFTECEEPEILLALRRPGLNAPPAADLLANWLNTAHWHGKPSRIDPAPGYRWPAIDQVAAASRAVAGVVPTLSFALLPPLAAHPTQAGAAQIIRQRRSAQRFDPEPTLAKTAFYRLLDALLPRPQLPWLAQQAPSRIHLLLFVLRVEGLASGLYLLPRTPGAAQDLANAMAPADQRFTARRAVAAFDSECPAHLGLLQLAEMALPALQRLARSLSCHQDIAATSAFSLAMLGEFETAITQGELDAHGYRDLLREAGLIGQVLYLEAEAAGVRGTGIGCFFDDPVHQLLGLNSQRYQSVYHFTVGTPINDQRIETGPPYPQRRL
ncbi:MAG: nitroreductase family protein [Azonexus sp.]|nr:nitroreductase family protein [Azonexus sp.]MDZ4315516.1 nitroreductase family protein [Azonexus sp.]